MISCGIRAYGVSYSGEIKMLKKSLTSFVVLSLISSGYPQGLDTSKGAKGDPSTPLNSGQDSSKARVLNELPTAYNVLDNPTLNNQLRDPVAYKKRSDEVIQTQMEVEGYWGTYPTKKASGKMVYLKNGLHVPAEIVDIYSEYFRDVEGDFRFDPRYRRADLLVSELESVEKKDSVYLGPTLTQGIDTAKALVQDLERKKFISKNETTAFAKTKELKACLIKKSMVDDRKKRFVLGDLIDSYVDKEAGQLTMAEAQRLSSYFEVDPTENALLYGSPFLITATILMTIEKEKRKILSKALVKRLRSDANEIANIVAMPRFDSQVTNYTNDLTRKAEGYDQYVRNVQTSVVSKQTTVQNSLNKPTQTQGGQTLKNVQGIYFTELRSALDAKNLDGLEKARRVLDGVELKTTNALYSFEEVLKYYEHRLNEWSEEGFKVDQKKSRTTSNSKRVPNSLSKETKMVLSEIKRGVSNYRESYFPIMKMYLKELQPTQESINQVKNEFIGFEKQFKADFEKFRAKLDQAIAIENQRAKIKSQKNATALAKTQKETKIIKFTLPTKITPVEFENNTLDLINKIKAFTQAQKDLAYAIERASYQSSKKTNQELAKLFLLQNEPHKMLQYLSRIGQSIPQAIGDSTVGLHEYAKRLKGYQKFSGAVASQYQELSAKIQSRIQAIVGKLGRDNYVELIPNQTKNYYSKITDVHTAYTKFNQITLPSEHQALYQELKILNDKIQNLNAAHLQSEATKVVQMNIKNAKVIKLNFSWLKSRESVASLLFLVGAIFWKVNNKMERQDRLSHAIHESKDKLSREILEKRYETYKEHEFFTKPLVKMQDDSIHRFVKNLLEMVDTPAYVKIIDGEIEKLGCEGV